MARHEDALDFRLKLRVLLEAGSCGRTRYGSGQKTKNHCLPRMHHEVETKFDFYGLLDTSRVGLLRVCREESPKPALAKAMECDLHERLPVARGGGEPREASRI